jgi:hemoglobin
MDRIRDDIHPPKKMEAAGTGAAPGTRPAAGTPPVTRPPVAGELPGAGTKSAAPTEAPRVKSLWDRLGGEKGVRKVVDDITASAAKDPKVDFTRGGKIKLTPEDVTKFKQEMVEWVSDQTGGPLRYRGKGMKVVHEGMHITNAQFDALVGLIKDALEQNGVKPDDEAAVLKGVEATRKAIVEQTPEEAPKPDRKPEASKPEAKGGTVSGIVTYKGKPLAGTITLTAKDGTAVSGAIAEDGTYLVKAVKPGAYTITVSEPKDKKDKDATIPAVYGDPTKSPLMFEVTEGQNTFDIQLK